MDTIPKSLEQAATALRATIGFELLSELVKQELDELADMVGDLDPEMRQAAVKVGKFYGIRD